MPQNRSFVGIDVSKARLDIHVHPQGEAFALDNNKTGWRTLVQRLRKLDIPAVALEASGGYEKKAARHLVQAGFAVYLLDPAQVRSFARGLRRHAKTDALDACMIARCLQAGIDKAVAFQPDPMAERLAELVAYRAKLVGERTALLAYRDTREQAIIRRMVEGRLNALKVQIVSLDREIARLIASTDGFARRAQLIASAPGVGPVLVASLLALLPELGRTNAKVIAALVGVAPFARQSGLVDRHGRCRGGRHAVRSVLYMATLSAIRSGKGSIASFYDRLRKSGKPAKLAIVAAMRKLITALNAMVRDNKPWTATA